MMLDALIVGVSFQHGSTLSCPGNLIVAVYGWCALPAGLHSEVHRDLSYPPLVTSLVNYVSLRCAFSAGTRAPNYLLPMRWRAPPARQRD